MKLISYHIQGTQSFGLLVDGQKVIDLRNRLPQTYTGFKAIFENNTLNLLRKYIRDTPDYDLNELNLLPPIPDADKHICIGVNYPSRNEEYKDQSSLPERPSVFLRTRESFVGHNQPLLIPPESDQFDYEGEIVLVIGKEGRRISKANAYEYIAGISIMNEGTLRDWVRHAKFNVTQGKNFTASGSWGPFLITLDEISSLENLRLRTYVNDELRQDDTSDRLMFSFKYLLEYLSIFFTLKPGDVIATGTPTGAGARFTPPRYLKSGDKVKIEVSEIGFLQNSVEKEFS